MPENSKSSGNTKIQQPENSKLSISMTFLVFIATFPKLNEFFKTSSRQFEFGQQDRRFDIEKGKSKLKKN